MSGCKLPAVVRASFEDDETYDWYPLCNTCLLAETNPRPRMRTDNLGVICDYMALYDDTCSCTNAPQ